MWKFRFIQGHAFGDHWKTVEGLYRGDWKCRTGKWRTKHRQRQHIDYEQHVYIEGFKSVIPICSRSFHICRIQRSISQICVVACLERYDSSSYSTQQFLRAISHSLGAHTAAFDVVLDASDAKDDDHQQQQQQQQPPTQQDESTTALNNTQSADMYLWGTVRGTVWKSDGVSIDPPQYLFLCLYAFQRYCRFCAPARHFFPPSLLTISPCSHESRWMALRLCATKGEGVGLIVRAITFQDFQPMWSWSINVTDTAWDRRTDEQHRTMQSQDRAYLH